MQFLAKNSHGVNCLSEYTSDTHKCMNTHGKDKTKYRSCLADATMDLEACSLEDLILDENKFKKYDVDTTAYMNLEQVMATQKEMDAMIAAVDWTYKKYEKAKPGSEKAAAFYKYKKKFQLEKKSIDLEVKITKKRDEIDAAGTGEAQATQELGKLAEKLADYKKLLAGLKKSWGVEDKRRGQLKAALKIARKERDALKEKHEQQKRNLFNNDKLREAYQKVINTEVGDIDAAEARLIAMLKARVLQPKHIERPGYTVSVWKGDDEIKYETFNWKRAKPLTTWVEEGWLEKNHQTKIQRWIQPHLPKGSSVDAQKVLIKVEGTILVTADAAYDFHICADGVSKVYLGDEIVDKHMILSHDSTK